MPKLSKYCFYILALFLPLQTIFAQYFTIKLGLPNWLNFWKELLIVIVGIQLSIQIVKKLLIKQIPVKLKIINLIPILLVKLATIVVLFNSIVFGEFHASIFVIGFRFELFWLWFFGIVSSWLNLIKPYEKQDFKQFINTFNKFILAGITIVFLIIGLELAFGQQNILQFAGFGLTGNNSEYIISAPSCHVVDFGDSDCRLSGTFSTPNHLAGYLLIVLAILLISLKQALYSNSYKFNRKVIFYLVYSILAIIFIFMTSARYAIIAVLIWAIVNLFNYLKIIPRIKKMLIGLTMLIPLIITLFPIYIGFSTHDPKFNINNKFLPVFITKQSSTVEHYRSTMASLSVFSYDPDRIFTGFGLGNSGPAAKPQYQSLSDDNLLHKKYYQIAYDWYIHADRINIPENWYIQLLLNGGLLYAVLYILLLFYPVKNLLKYFASSHKKFNFETLQISMGFFAILSGNLFLHLWENQTISIYWTLLWLWSYSLIHDKKPGNN